MSSKTYIKLLLLTIVIGVIFALFPQLDIALSKPFYTTSWRFEISPFANLLRKIGIYLPIGLVVISVLSLIVGYSKLKLSAFSIKNAWFIIITGILSPILIVNVVLKNHWHRARPYSVKEFGGDFTFTPFYEIGKECVKNCSFVSGEAAGVFWLLCLSFIAQPPFRKPLTIAILIFACFMSFLRLAFGKHFTSDLFFAAFISYSVVFITHSLMYRDQK
jgi:hypothetical protein